MNRTGSWPARVALIAGQTFNEAMHQRLLPLLLALAVLLAGAAYGLRILSFGETEARFLTDAGLGAQAFFGAILAVVATPQLFFAELDRRSALQVLSRPVRRSEFVLGKLSGVMLVLAAFCAVTTALTLALLAWHGLTGGMEANSVASSSAYLGVIGCGVAQWLKLGVLAAVTLLVASYAGGSLFATLAGFLVLVAGELQHVARDYYAMLASPFARGAAGIFSLVVPDFRLFALTDGAMGGGAVPLDLLPGLALYAAAYTAAFGLLAAWCFHRRDL